MSDAPAGGQWVERAGADWNDPTSGSPRLTPPQWTGSGAGSAPSDPQLNNPSVDPQQPTSLVPARQSVLDSAPGWYPDPHGPTGERWWDGTMWTEHVQGTETVQPDGIFQAAPSPNSTSTTPNGSDGAETPRQATQVPAVHQSTTEAPLVPTTPPGWHQDPYGPPGHLRWFDGTQWSAHVQAPQPQYQPAAQTVVVAGAGSAAATSVSVSAGPNNALHLVLTILTCGLWLPVWILIAIFSRKKVSVSTATAAQSPGTVVINAAPHQPTQAQQGFQQHPPPPSQPH